MTCADEWMPNAYTFRHPRAAGFILGLRRRGRSFAAARSEAAALADFLCGLKGRESNRRAFFGGEEGTLVRSGMLAVEVDGVAVVHAERPDEGITGGLRVIDEADAAVEQHER